MLRNLEEVEVKVKVSKYELSKIKENTLDSYKNKSNKGLSSDEFWGKCALNAVHGFLKRNNIDIEIDYPDKDYKTID